MLRIESYITPFLTSYLNRFILNLTSEDLKLSIWGGDVVLTNLKLRLDIAESLAGLPFRINSVSITSNKTLEIIKNYRDTFMSYEFISHGWLSHRNRLK